MVLQRIRYAVVVVLLVVGAAHSQAAPQQAAQMLVSTSWLNAHARDKNVIVLQVGANQASYAAGHIPGAYFLSLSDIAVSGNGIPNELPPIAQLKSVLEKAGVSNHSRVILYDDMGGLLAARAYFTFDYVGLANNAAILDGGLASWKAERRATSSDSAPARAASLTLVKSHPEVIVDLPTVMKTVAEHRATLIDARSPSDYAGVKGGAGALRKGHIPGAKDVFWMDNIVSRENPVLKSQTEIRAHYLATGTKPGAKVIVYCQSGIQASHDYFTLKLLGFKPVLYDGSFAEWVAAFGTAVETSAN